MLLTSLRPYIRQVCVVVLVASVAWLIVARGCGAYTSMMCELVYVRAGEPPRQIAGWGWRKKWSDSGELRGLKLFNTTTGYQVLETNQWAMFGGRHETTWSPDGKISKQSRGGLDIWTLPPWRWGKADQSAPCAPWIELGIDADAWFDSRAEKQEGDGGWMYTPREPHE